MAITDMPPARASEIDLESPDLPFHLLKLQDDLARSRMREAFWISLIFHMVVVFLLIASPKWLPSRHGTVLVATPADLMKDKDLTYLEMPRDSIKPKVRPNTDIISDKDRIAMSRHPDNAKQFRAPRNVMPPGPPQTPGPRAAQPAPQVAQASPPSPPAQQRQQQPGGQSRPDNTNNMVARLEPPPSASARQVFGGGAMSPGSAIAQAARAASQARGGGGGMGGDWGLGEGMAHGAVGPAEILSDTMGVDFGPYLQRVIHAVRDNWYSLIPEEARAPLLKRGKVSIEFAILKDGSVAGLRIVGPSGDIALDRAAYGGITASNPFQPLPQEFKGQYLALRFHFYYNPAKGELE